MKKHKRRIRIPIRIEEAVLFDSDRTCCLCRSSNAVQVHHIDGNPGNNTIDNLAVLCINCHDQITKKGGITKNTSPGLVRKYQDEWYKIVRKRKAKQISDVKIRDLSERKVLNLLAIHEIRNIKASLSAIRDVREYEKELNKLRAFVGFEYDSIVKLELMGALSSFTIFDFKTESASELAYHISCLTTAALPISSLVSSSKSKISKSDKDVLLAAATMGFSMCYLPTHRKLDLNIIDAGAKIMWDVLRFLHLNKCRSLEKEILRYFERLKEIAKTKDFNDAYRWLDFMEKDALALDPPLPQLPEDIESKLKF